jgi:hypothetical protein
MGLPEIIIVPHRYKVRSIEAIAMVCNRLAFPSRLCTMETLFGRHHTSISRITTFMFVLLERKFREILYLDVDRVKARLQVFSDSIKNQGAPLDKCWGFVDGTARYVCRPSRHQRALYSGYYRSHCLKYHAVTTPDGLITHLYGPVAGLT